MTYLKSLSLISAYRTALQTRCIQTVAAAWACLSTSQQAAILAGHIKV